jgi:hypothetical protein
MMPFDLPAIVMEENAAVIQLATEECAMMKRCKHFLNCINFVRQYMDNLITINKIATDKNSADLMSNILRGVEFDNPVKIGKLLGATRPFPSGRENEKDQDPK